MTKKNRNVEKEKFGDRLKRVLQQAGLSATDVAHSLDVTPAAVSAWARSVREPKIEVLDKLYRVYGFNPFYLVTGEGPPLLDRSSPDLYLQRKKKHLRRRKFF